MEIVRPPQSKREDLAIKLGFNPEMNLEICGASANRESKETPSAVTITLQREGPLEVLKG